MICLEVPLASVAAPVAATLRKTLREWLLSEGLSCPGSSYAVEKNKSPTFENLQVTGTLKSLKSLKLQFATLLHHGIMPSACYGDPIDCCFI